MSQSPKGIKATDQRMNFLCKAKQARFDKKLKISSQSRGLKAMVTQQASNAPKDYKIWAASGNIKDAASSS